MTLDLLPLRFHFTALDAIRFPRGRPGNILRGGLGAALRRVAGEAEYARLFAPASASGPSGLADPPRPFVLRARHLDDRTFATGEEFEFQVNLFDLRETAVEALRQAFAELAREGLGPGRGRATLARADVPGDPVHLSLDPAPDAVRRIRVDFLSPTELKPAGPPGFGVLFARVRDRISTLRALYGSGPAAIDFQAAGERATAVRLARCEVQSVTAERRSSRTGEVHSIGGFTGTAEYEGDLDEFVPWLEAAAFTGVGRHTVWGNGEVRTSRLP